ncbi:sulfate adenylyltransferase subunit CysN [Ferrimonas sediminicola]|uniref:Sulfate adenylyltransferase subunit 1 n=1 Tax=Ferrimonas sediminicola TaxID=2569538 RepID=A0A4U1BGY7_9GAMM|nr:sulfate adenylyltransferase subunit CysN [Ferrimonas sediminicola]TKB49992.1 sulfate adenylyltransferase subunit CysN [Ferrimonas sediminicola]
MTNNPTKVALRVEQYLKQHESKALLRFITCGSVDDGKSTLIGRLLHDTKALYDDQLEAVSAQSRTQGTTGERPDLALLVDGLQAEREQGITIDVAYRYFSTDKRKFIIADTPGHEQYTRNMATGASTADLAIILVDARYGVMEQTRRHSFLVSLLGIRQVVVAINKMDLKGYDRQVFEAIAGQYAEMASELGFDEVHYLPISALEGDNVAELSPRMPWYQGPSLLALLEQAPGADRAADQALRLPVQLVMRPNLDFRGFAGTLASGALAVGQGVKVLPSGNVARVTGILQFGRQLQSAVAGQAVTVTLDREIDISRGDWLVSDQDSVPLSRALRAKLVWMADDPLQPDREYRIKLASTSARARVGAVEHRVDIRSWEAIEADTLELNDIGQVVIQSDRPLPVDRYGELRDTGAFILIDPVTNGTVAAGMVQEAAEDNAQATGQYSQFELELNALIRKHFPHWDARDISKFTGDGSN